MPMTGTGKTRGATWKQDSKLGYRLRKNRFEYQLIVDHEALLVLAAMCKKL